MLQIPPPQLEPRRSPGSSAGSMFWVVLSAAAVILGGVALLVGLVAVTFGAFSIFGPSFVGSCSGAGQRELLSRSDFVRRHVPEATGFTVYSYDCDSGGSAFLKFDAPGSAMELRTAFLADPACTLWTPSLDDEAAVAVVCETDRRPLMISLDDLTVNFEDE